LIFIRFGKLEVVHWLVVFGCLFVGMFFSFIAYAEIRGILDKRVRFALDCRILMNVLMPLT
jgi:hypothetical protein